MGHFLLSLCCMQISLIGHLSHTDDFLIISVGRLARRHNLRKFDETLFRHTVQGFLDIGINNVNSLDLIVVNHLGNNLEHGVLILVGARKGHNLVEGFALHDVQTQDISLSGLNGASYHRGSCHNCFSFLFIVLIEFGDRWN
nr:MAG TPA: hypothetical protein [Caudoviricetes sp.]